VHNWVSEVPQLVALLQNKVAISHFAFHMIEKIDLGCMTLSLCHVFVSLCIPFCILLHRILSPSMFFYTSMSHLCHILFYILFVHAFLFASFLKSLCILFFILLCLILHHFSFHFVSQLCFLCLSMSHCIQFCFPFCILCMCRLCPPRFYFHTLCVIFWLSIPVVCMCRLCPPRFYFHTLCVIFWLSIPVVYLGYNLSIVVKSLSFLCIFIWKRKGNWAC